MNDIPNNCSEISGQFNFSEEILDEIQKNIEEIISNFPVPEDNKLDVIKKINFMYSQTRYLSLTDALTGLYNRRHFNAELEREFMRSKRYGGNLCIAIIDIDFFKKINDTYGHLCGDYVLKEVAYLILENFRKTDMVFRYGGEEFVVIMTETSLENSLIPLERLRKTIENNNFIYKGKKITVTISIGVETNQTDTTDEFLNNADKALYQAKQNGRNQTVLFK